MRGLYIGVVPYLMGEVFANVLGGETLRVAWVRVAFQDVSFDNITACHSNQLYLYSSLSRVVSVTDLVSIYLEDFDARDIIVLKPVIDVEVRAEGNPLLVYHRGTRG